MGWLNYYGLIFLFLIAVPNIVLAVTHKQAFNNVYKNKAVEIIEQIGRVGCFIFVFINIPSAVNGFWFDGAKVAYFVVGGVLVTAYLIGWVALWRKNSVFKAVYLSVTPSLMFASCGVFTLNIPLLVACVIFAPAHIHISYKNAVAKDN